MNVSHRIPYSRRPLGQQRGIIATMRRPAATDTHAQKLMGLENDAARFEEIRNKICDFCVAKLPVPEEMNKYLDAVRNVKMLVLAGLTNIKHEYKAEIRNIRLHLADPKPDDRTEFDNKTSEFLFRWAVACNESGSVRDRKRLHPFRDLLATRNQDMQQTIEDDVMIGTTDKADQSRSAGLQSSQLLPDPNVSQPQRRSLSPAPIRSDLASLTEVETEHKRKIDQVEASDDGELERPSKLVTISVSTEASSVQELIIQPAINAPPDWKTIILHFKAMDLNSSSPGAKAARVPLKKFFYVAQSDTVDTNPYELKFEDLNSHIRGTLMGQSLDDNDIYARLAGDSATPAPLDNGELSVIFMKWESLRSVSSRFEEIVVELWKCIEMFSEVAKI